MNDKLSQKIALAQLNPKHLELIIYPTEKCNFRCVYCYEDFEQGQMSPEVIDSLNRFIAARIKTLKVLHLNWFGGEPLLAKSVILKVARLAQLDAQQNNVEFSGSLTTNGYYLDLETVQQLSDVRHKKYQVSLDGYKNGHDETRRHVNGKGTFDRIWSNLKALSASAIDFNITLRIHVTNKNLNTLFDLALAYREEFSQDRRFGIFLKAIENLGGEGSKPLSIKSGTERQAILQELEAAFGLTERKTADGIPKPKICYASRPNALTIRATGKIQKCTVMLDNDANNVGKLNPDGTVELDPEKMGHWMRGYENFDSKALACPASTSYAKASRIIQIVPN